VNTVHPTGPAQIYSTVSKISIHCAEVGVSTDISKKRKSRSKSLLPDESPFFDVVIGPELSSDNGYSIKQKNKLEMRVKELEYMNKVLKVKCHQYHTKVNKIICLGNAAQFFNEVLVKKS